LDSLQVLMIRKVPLQSLDHIETHPLLEQVYLSEPELLDLSPLLYLPRLQLVEVDESMREAAEAIAEKAQFKIVYQQHQNYCPSNLKGVQAAHLSGYFI
jgi:hypothetical protein